MTSKRKESEPLGQPEVDPATGKRLIETRIRKGQLLLLQSQPLTSDEYEKWELITENYLIKAFGKNSPNVKKVMDVGALLIATVQSEAWWEERRTKNLTSQIALLEGLAELLGTELNLCKEASNTSTEAPRPKGHRIFLVHGHDESALHKVEQFLGCLGQDVVILRKQANEGRTIIEKFEDYADVGFAVVLLTADDRGGSVSASHSDLQSRARQNVILELGYFLGRLGRSRVCALHVDGVEIPSDYSGVLYVKLDDHGGWKLELAKELRAAGFSVDLNKAI